MLGHNLFAGKLVGVDEINDWVHLRQRRLRMSQKEPKDRAPELRVLYSLPEAADDNFAGKHLAASQTACLAVAQGLGNGVMVRRLANVMFVSDKRGAFYTRGLVPR
jgi:hypothetical protein